MLIPYDLELFNSFTRHQKTHAAVAQKSLDLIAFHDFNFYFNFLVLLHFFSFPRKPYRKHPLKLPLSTLLMEIVPLIHTATVIMSLESVQLRLK